MLVGLERLRVGHLAEKRPGAGAAASTAEELGALSRIGSESAIELGEGGDGEEEVAPRGLREELYFALWLTATLARHCKPRGFTANHVVLLRPRVRASRANVRCCRM